MIIAYSSRVSGVVEQWTTAKINPYSTHSRTWKRHLEQKHVHFSSLYRITRLLAMLSLASEVHGFRAQLCCVWCVDLWCLVSFLCKVGNYSTDRSVLHQKRICIVALVCILLVLTVLTQLVEVSPPSSLSMTIILSVKALQPPASS